MQEDNVVKAYARSNFGLGLTRSTQLPTTTQIHPNLASNTSVGQSFSNNFARQSDALEYNNQYAEVSEEEAS